jgi:glutathione S-transferase
MELFCIAGTCSLAPHILLEEIGEPFTVKLLDRSASEQKAPAYLAINPSGKVPALRVDGGVITENVAIQVYLADRFPALGLAPVELIARGQWLSYLAWLGGSVHEFFRRWRRPEQYSDDAAAHAGISAAGQANFLKSLAQIDDRIANQEWICGDQFTTADTYTLVFHLWARLSEFPISHLTHLKRHGDAIMSRPSAQSAFKREGLSIDLMA